MTPRELELFMSKVKQAKSGCWLWTGAIQKDGREYGYAVSGGYGIAVVSGHTQRAHKVSYEHYVGPVPDGMTLEHTCHTAHATCKGGPDCVHRRCVNPKHLTRMSRGDNARAGAAKITHCPKRHAYTEANTKLDVTKSGGVSRTCRECVRQRAKARYLAAHPEAKPRGSYKKYEE